MITANITKPIKVKFIKPIFEDDFVEEGMIAYLTKVEWDTHYDDCYKLHFDFSEFEEENAPLFSENYWPNCHVVEIQKETGRTLFTAKEVRCYDPNYWVYFSCGDMITRDDKTFEEAILEYLIEV